MSLNDPNPVRQPRKPQLSDERLVPPLLRYARLVVATPDKPRTPADHTSGNPLTQVAPGLGSLVGETQAVERLVRIVLSRLPRQKDTRRQRHHQPFPRAAD